jgi:hypothetical protein
LNASNPPAATRLFGEFRDSEALACGGNLVLQMLATLDAQVVFEGAGMTPLVPHSSGPRWPVVLSQLPAVPFRAAGPQTQPLVVRCGQTETATWIYIANTSALSVSVSMVLDCPESTVGKSVVDGGVVIPAHEKDGKSEVSVNLAGFGFWAARFERPGVNVESTQVVFEKHSLAQMQQRIERLNSNMRIAAKTSAKAGEHTTRRNAESKGARQVNWEETGRHPDSLDKDEIRQLTKIVAAVKLAYEEARYSDCQRLLDGYWGQLLLSMPVEMSAPDVAPTKFTDRLRDKIKR